MMDRLACLRELATVLDELVVAAQVRDGEALADLVTRYRVASDRLAAFPLATPGDPDATEIARLSREVLGRQATLETGVAPWMDDLRILLRERRAEAALAATYRPAG